MGPLPVKDKTKEELVRHASEHGDLDWDKDSYEVSAKKAAEMLALVASTREYQFGLVRKETTWPGSREWRLPDANYYSPG